jgi:hypothetical protein
MMAKNIKYDNIKDQKGVLGPNNKDNFDLNDNDNRALYKHKETQRSYTIFKEISDISENDKRLKHHKINIEINSTDIDTAMYEPVNLLPLVEKYLKVLKDNNIAYSYKNKIYLNIHQYIIYIFLNIEEINYSLHDKIKQYVLIEHYIEKYVALDMLKKMIGFRNKVEESKTFVRKIDIKKIIPNRDADETMFLMAHHIQEERKSLDSQLLEVFNECEQNKLTLEHDNVYQQIINNFVSGLTDNISKQFYTDVDYIKQILNLYHKQEIIKYFEGDHANWLNGIIRQILSIFFTFARYLFKEAIVINYEDPASVLKQYILEAFTTSNKTSLKRIKNIRRNEEHYEKYSKEYTDAFIRIRMNIKDDNQTAYITMSKTYFTAEPAKKVSVTQFDAICAAFSNMEKNLLKLIIIENKR